jgi:hypothetical protein
MWPYQIIKKNTKLASNSKTHAEQDSSIQFIRFGSNLSSRPWVRVLNNLDTRSHNNDLVTIIASKKRHSHIKSGQHPCTPKRDTSENDALTNTQLDEIHRPK